MTVDYVKSLCFESRPTTLIEYKELLIQDLKYAVGALVYLRPLKEILDNPRVLSCSYDEGRGIVTLITDDDTQCDLYLTDWDKPKQVRELEICRLGHYNIKCCYYGIYGGWLDEYMIRDVPKKQKLLNSIKRFR